MNAILSICRKKFLKETHKHCFKKNGIMLCFCFFRALLHAYKYIHINLRSTSDTRVKTRRPVGCCHGAAGWSVAHGVHHRSASSA